MSDSVSHSVRRRAKRWQLLQAAALIKLYKLNQLDRLGRGPIDPAKILTPDEVVAALNEAQATVGKSNR